MPLIVSFHANLFRPLLVRELKISSHDLPTESQLFRRRRLLHICLMLFVMHLPSDISFITSRTPMPVLHSPIDLPIPA